MLIHNYLFKSAEKNGNKDALIIGDKRYNYNTIADEVNRCSYLLNSLNINKSDRVIVYLENSFEAVISIFSILKATGVFITIHPQVKSEKMKFIINDSDAKILITDCKHLNNIENIVDDCQSLKKILLIDFNDWTKRDQLVGNIEIISFYKECEGNNSDNIEKTIDVDLASIIYTSGSTGFPKGVMHSHRTMSHAVDSITTYLENNSNDIILNVLPLSFDYGLYQVLMTFKFGGTIVLEKAFVYPHQILKRISDENVTGFPIVPTIAVLLLKMKGIEKYDFHSLRYITNTAQQLPRSIIFSLCEKFPNVRIFSMYGLTECKRVSFLPPEKILIKPDSVGKAMPNIEAFIIDENKHVITKPGITGELIVRGSNVMLGYWNNREETDKTIREGYYMGDRWLYTGDLFKMDEDYDLYFCGRRDDIIKTSGEKVSPKEIENVLYEIECVQEAAVIGVDDEILGQAIKAFVCLNEENVITKDEILQYCSKHLERFMIPKYIEFLSFLPKTKTGKINKKELK